MSIKLAHRTIVITGGSSGTGLATASLAAQRSAHLHQPEMAMTAASRGCREALVGVRDTACTN